MILIYIEYQIEEPEKARVVFQMFKPSLLSEERKQNGLLVEAIPEPENSGIPLLYVNPVTKDLWYEYVSAPPAPLYAPTAEGQLQKQIDDLKLLLADILTGGPA